MSKIVQMKDWIGEYPIVWQITYEYEGKPLFLNEDTGLLEPGSARIMIGEFHVVAATEALARAAFELRRPPPSYKITEIEKILVIDAIVPVRP